MRVKTKPKTIKKNKEKDYPNDWLASNRLSVRELGLIFLKKKSINDWCLYLLQRKWSTPPSTRSYNL
jgi:hypothetical protein